MAIIDYLTEELSALSNTTRDQQSGPSSMPAYSAGNVGKLKSYPMEKPSNVYKAKGGVLTYTTPQIFMSKVPPFNVGKEDVETINELMLKMLDGQKLKPAIIVIDDENNVVYHDGRHRALAADSLGIKQYPVIVLNDNGERVPEDINFSALKQQNTENKKGE